MWTMKNLLLRMKRKERLMSPWRAWTFAYVTIVKGWCVV